MKQNMNTLSITNDFLKNNKLVAKKKFGQNFLIDDNVLEKIVEAGNLKQEGSVIEIGPGLGNLTYYLLESTANVTAFEIDTDMVQILQERFDSYKNFNLVNEDIMDVNLNDILSSNTKVIANLPYYITTPILFKLLKYKDRISSIVVMVQKEVALRLISSTNIKDYGALTVSVKLVANVEKVIDVSRNSFLPAPNVDSAVVKIDIDNEKVNKIKDLDFTYSLVKAAFSARRKKVINSLINSNVIHITKDKLIDIIIKCGLNENTRAEEISVDKYIELANMLVDNM